MVKRLTSSEPAPIEGAAAGYVVDRVVICDAYREPDKHYKLLAGGRSELAPGRRPSMSFLASAKATKGGIAGVVGKGATLLEDMLASEEQLNDYVNQLRDDVRAWRERGYRDPNPARVTRRLLEWWFERDEERRFEFKRFFFCQQEAIESVIYLYEGKHRYKFSETGDLIRYALKLATGAGKTHLMALLVVWSTLHKLRVSGSYLSTNFLILVPNLTVRDRVWGTDPLTKEPTGEGLDPDSLENIYDRWDVVPPEYNDEFHAKVDVKVRNWQSIPLEVNRADWLSEEVAGPGRFVPASVHRAIRRRQRRADPRAAVRRVLGNWRDLVIINDEAHHVYGEKRSPKDTEPQYIKWSKIIDRIKEAATISLVADLSATPWYGSGSAKDSGKLFEWLVSDFSVYDAFESGLVKVVRLPDPDEEGYRYLNLWDQVQGAKTKEEYIPASRGAIASIYASWSEEYDEWAGPLPALREGPPPVMLVVADRHERAKWLFEHLTSYYALLSNEGEDPLGWVTIQVDSTTFDAEKGKEAVLREMVSTVGQPGKAGEHVRCIVSVNMLSEGWNVKNVTHILGLRAFGSPLLTEQVIGRGLRRVDTGALNVPLEERAQNPNRPDEETVDAFGIPFVGFPVEKRKRPKIRGWSEKPTSIGPDKKKESYAVELPNVRSWAVGVSRPIIETTPVHTLPSLVIDKETPAIVKMRPVVGGDREVEISIERFRAEYPVMRSKFMVAQELFDLVSKEADGILVGPTFEEVLELASQYIDERVEVLGDNMKEDFAIPFWYQKALNILQTAVQEAPADMVTVPISGEPAFLRTGEIPEFKWPGVLAEGKKAHWSQVPCHTELEAQFSRFLDAADDVVKYVKNERLGFSITYYENGRPRQYYPDFAALIRNGEAEAWWLVETKGEIRENTRLKQEAADLWCDRMTRSGNGRWEHLFVQQKQFEKSMGKARTFMELADTIRPARAELTLIPTDDPRVEKEKFKVLLPLYSLEAAAGYFGEGKAVELEGWIEATGVGKLSEDMFVARAVGRSMEPRISDGDLLVFRANPAGTRQGKIVLARGELKDPELGGPYTVKKFSSKKVADPETGWRHRQITLSPLNPEFEPIVIELVEEGADPNVVVVAEYLNTLRP